MAEFWSDERIEQVIADAEQRSPSLQQALAALAEARRARLHDRVRELRTMILEASIEETQRHEQVAKALAAAEQQIEAFAAPAPKGFVALDGLLNLLIVVAVLAVFPGYLVVGIVSSWGAPFRWVMQPQVMLGLVIAAALLVPLIWLHRRLRKRRDAQTEQTRQVMRLNADIDGMREQLRQLERAAVVQGTDAAGRAWGRALAEFVEPVYDLAFSATDTPGLNTAFSPHLVVETPARTRLLGLIGTLRGASIGIAGPRGAGKSTVIQSLCAPHVQRLGAREVLTLVTSAPVEYETRDFLLHLFSSLCHRVIDRIEGGTVSTSPRQPSAQASRMPLDVYRIAFVAALAGLGLGLVLLMLSGVMAHQTVLNRQLAAAKAAAPASAAALASLAASGAPAASAPGLGASAVDYVTVFDMLQVLGVSPSASLVAALALLAGGSALLLMVSVQARRLHRADAHQTPAPSPDDSAAPWSAVAAWVRRIYRTLQSQDAPVQADALVQQARAWLEEVKFQQSWTMGWSGALKTPLGVEGSVSQARSMAQQQLSLPEIADAFVQLVARVADRYTVIIGIDELDKIETDEKAHRFLNDIKVVFGVKSLKGVFYLVSVSENAMSQFERRGLPFRDAFDSAFDEVVAVRHLDFASAKLMLSERVIGLPVPFQALVWVLSGGLARELVRSARNLVEHLPSRAHSAPGQLGEIALALVRHELAAKARAVAYAAERLVTTPATVALLRLVDALPALQPITAQSLVDAQRELHQLAQPPRRAARDRGQDDTGKAVVELAAELSSYVLYLAAVLHFFDATLTRQRLDAALPAVGTDDGRLALLPTALRSMAVHPELARGRLVSFFQRGGIQFSPPL